MQPTRPNGRGRLVLAVLVSLALHGLAGYAWLSARAEVPAAGPGIDVTVDSPEDDGLTVTLREPKVPLAPPRKLPDLPPDPPSRPATTAVETTGAGPGATTQIGPSSIAPESLPKSTGPAPLHGKLKAGKTIVYVLDRSSSMGIDGMLPRAVAALRASLGQLGPDARFQIVAYNGSTTTFAPEPVAAMPDAVERAGLWLSTLVAEGASNHRAGFKEAFAARPDVVFLLTDADDLEESDVRGIAGMNRKPARILAAVFGGARPVSETPLERLVSLTGGRIQFVTP